MGILDEMSNARSCEECSQCNRKTLTARWKQHSTDERIERGGSFQTTRLYRVVIRLDEALRTPPKHLGHVIVSKEFTVAEDI
ncbi:hypothetical protein H4Q26_006035 [Puccinia striiformis f. sp. tritici PST-130]|nr:hypothetical protein H4Q26_006035 [Puccinia striiformis f. sp. tritici PST-130]